MRMVLTITVALDHMILNSILTVLKVSCPKVIGFDGTHILILDGDCNILRRLSNPKEVPQLNVTLLYWPFSFFLFIQFVHAPKCMTSYRM